MLCWCLLMHRRDWGQRLGLQSRCSAASHCIARTWTLVTTWLTLEKGAFSVWGRNSHFCWQDLDFERAWDILGSSRATACRGYGQPRILPSWYIILCLVVRSTQCHGVHRAVWGTNAFPITRILRDSYGPDKGFKNLEFVWIAWVKI